MDSLNPPLPPPEQPKSAKQDESFLSMLPKIFKPSYSTDSYGKNSITT